MMRSLPGRRNRALVVVMYRAGLLRTARRADAVIAVSRHTAEDLARRTRLPAGKIHVVPLAASLPAASAGLHEVLSRLKVPSPYVLFVGTRNIAGGLAFEF